MDKQMTAVSWLEERFEKYLAWQEGHPKATPYTLNELSNDFQQAKALERERIEEAYLDGVQDQSDYHSIPNVQPPVPSDYFTKTYGDEK